ncbi:hypothetical protein KJ785_01960 [Patescibacteria group bacterium]|nr:hypothetical protein [Patescibacteria group bacterium]
MKKIILVINIFLISLFLKTDALAQGLINAPQVVKGVANKAGVTQDDPASIVGAGLNVALSLVGLIFLILMVYAGYLWMTARGEEEQVKKAQKIIIASLIGVIIILGAYAITYIIIGISTSV